MHSTPSCARGDRMVHDSPPRTREAGDLGLADADVVERGESDAVTRCGPGRLLPATEVAVPPCWRVREWSVRRGRFGPR